MNDFTASLWILLYAVLVGGSALYIAHLLISLLT